MTRIQPTIVITIGAFGNAFGRSVYSRLMEEKQLGEYIHFINLSFTKEDQTLHYTTENNITSIELPLDVSTVIQTFEEKSDDILSLFIRPYAAIHEKLSRLLLQSGQNVEKSISFMLLSASFEPAAGECTFQIMRLLTKDITYLHDILVKYSGVYFLPPITLSPSDQAAAYSFLLRLDNLLNNPSSASMGAGQINGHFLVNTTEEIVEAVGYGSDHNVAAVGHGTDHNQEPCLQEPCLQEPCLQEPCLQEPCLNEPCLNQPSLKKPCLPETPVTEVISKLITDIDVFQECQGLNKGVMGTVIHGKKAHYGGFGAHFLEYDGQQLVRVLKNLLVHDLIFQILIAQPSPDNANFNKDLEEWKKWLFPKLKNLGNIAMKAAPAGPPADVVELCQRLEADNSFINQEGTDILDNIAKSIKNVESVKSTRSTKSIKSTTSTKSAKSTKITNSINSTYGNKENPAGEIEKNIDQFSQDLMTKVKSTIDQAPQSFARAAIMGDYFLGKKTPFFEEGKIDLSAEIIAPIAEDIIAPLLGLEFEKIQNPDAQNAQAEAAGNHGSMNKAEAAGNQCSMNKAGAIEDHCSMNKFKLTPKLMMSLKRWPPDISAVDSEVAEYIDGVKKIYMDLSHEASKIQEELDALRDEESKLRKEHGALWKALNLGQYRKELDELLLKQAQSKEKMGAISKEQGKIITEQYVPLLAQLFRCRCILEVFALAAQCIQEVSNKLDSCIRKFSKQADACLEKISQEEYLRTTLRTSLMSEESAREVYKREVPGLLPKLDEWVLFPDTEKAEYGHKSRSGLKYSDYDRKYHDKKYVLYHHVSDFLDDAEQGIIKLHDYAGEVFKEYQDKTISRMLQEMEADGGKEKIHLLKKTAYPMLRLQESIDLGNYQPPLVLFVGVDPESHIQEDLKSLHQVMGIFDNHHPQRIDIYSFIFGVPAFLLAQINALRKHYLSMMKKESTCQDLESFKKLESLPDLLPAFMIPNNGVE